MKLTVSKMRAVLGSLAADLNHVGFHDEARVVVAIAGDAFADIDELFDERDLTLEDFDEARAMRPYRPRKRHKHVPPKERLKRVRYYKKHKSKIAKQQRKYRKTHKMQLKTRHKLYEKRRKTAASFVDTVLDVPATE